MLLCYMFCWMLNDELNSMDETMANIIEKRIKTRPKKQKEVKKRAPALYQETTPKNTNPPTGVTKKSNDDAPKGVKYQPLDLKPSPIM